MGFQVIADPPRLHLVGEPGEPVFTTGFQNTGDPFLPVGFWRDADGLVHLQGNVELVSGSGTRPIFVLPPGFRRQSANITMPALFGSNNIATLTVNTLGEVSTFTLIGAFTLSLDGVVFHPLG